MSSTRSPGSRKDSDHGPRPKRPADEDRPPQRKKRGRYTLNACDECKRRKTKCTGETPCQLCKSLGEECEYSRETGEEVTQKYMNSAIQSLQRQIGELSSIVSTLRDEGIASQRANRASIEVESPASPDPSKILAETSDTGSVPPNNDSSQTGGPTNTSYAFQMLESSMHNQSSQPSAPASPPLTEVDAQRYHELATADDPLTAITPREIIRCLKLYEEELGLHNPHLEFQKMITCAETHSQHITAGPVAPHFACSSKCYLVEGSNSLIRAVVAIIMLLEGFKNRPVAQKLMDGLPVAENQRLTQDSKIEIDELSLIMLKAVYHFFTDNERLAWRLVGFVARMCLEIGLHRRDVTIRRYPDPEKRRHAITLFWTVYVLERRWSFGTGLPYSIHDADVDQSQNETDVAALYIRSMVSYCKIASDVWASTARPKSSADFPSDHECSFMEFQIIEWTRSLPGILQLADPHGGYDPARHNRGVYRLQMLQYLRGNQMRILINRPFLFSKAGINSHPDKARKAIENAKDSIRVLRKLYDTSNIYSRQHQVFNHFLDSSLAVLLLAVCNEPKGTADLVRKELSVALELMHTLSTGSPISKRLWNRLKKYRDIPHRLNNSKERSSSQKQASRDQSQGRATAPELQDSNTQNMASTSNRTEAEADLSSFPTPSISEAPGSYDPEFWKTYESLFSANAHMLDGLRGNLADWQTPAAQGVVSTNSQFGMNTPANVPTTWALNDPAANYVNITSPVASMGGSAQTYGPQYDNLMTPACFDDVSRDLFSF